MLQQVGAAAAGPDGAVLHLVVGGMHLLDEGAPWAAGRAAATAVTVRNLEGSFGRADPRALIQMATGSVKAFTAVNISYRLLKFAAAKRNSTLATKKAPLSDSAKPSQERQHWLG